ncbi:4'-phosphopantetheinyl transferase family protein [Mesorhizobium amorphae]|uniref:Enterobactin synthase component D n=1 Tax=Mesorhizobium amorphae CCNWGS0123 TaxID=1082933 RepID=G6YGA3_9HYPH|nr:4'-phosphopantetheinyl transferase superfamily protein [Mesorhizobium amorphae]EHH09284.1 4'-phosphopantetheinyl transferase [Mesorhizobium amorphae CCNWGS0123]
MEIIPSDHPNILIGIRRIEYGDQTALFSSEVATLGRAVAKVRRQSGAARIIARTLLGQMGFPPTPIVKTRSGVPTWPAGIVGSMAHHDTAAAAAIVEKKSIVTLGIDIEPNEPLPKELVELIATPRERQVYESSLLSMRILFVLKEAVYKAYFPIYQNFLDFQDVEIDMDARLGRVAKSNCTFPLEIHTSKNVIGLAYLYRPH